MAKSDIQIITDAFIEFGGSIFAEKLLEWNLRNDGIQVRTNVNAPQALTKLSAKGNVRPYRSDDDATGNGAKYTDRTLTAYQGKFDFDFDFEDFRNTYLAQKALNGGMMYEEALNHLINNYLSQIISDTLYLGVRDSNGTTAAALADGWGTIIAAEIVGGGITPVVTGAISSSNAEAKVKETVRSLHPKFRGMNKVTYVSWGVFDKYCDSYATNHGFQYQPSATGEYRIDNVNSILKPVDWMGDSSRIITTVPNNFVFGTDAERVAVYATPDRNISKTRLMMPVGCEIQDLDIIAVNDQA